MAHAQCWEEDEVDPLHAAAGAMKVLAARSKVAALDRVEAAWSSLEENFAFNESIVCVFRDSCGRFLKKGSAHTNTTELVAGFNPPELKTKMATFLDMKRSWKKHPDLVYSVAREAVEAWTTVEQADKLRRVQSRPKVAVARVGSDKEKQGAAVGRGVLHVKATWQHLELREGGL